VAQALEFFFDDEADAAVRSLWRRLDRAGVPAPRHRPHVAFAVAASIPAKAREALRSDLALLSIPNLWLSTLAANDAMLMLAAVADAELLAVHSAVHDALAGRVRSPSAYYLPGSWMPHCALTQGAEPPQVAMGFAAVYPVAPIKVRVSAIAVVDTATGAEETLLDLTG